jgi:hypothetical protein
MPSATSHLDHGFAGGSPFVVADVPVARDGPAADFVPNALLGLSDGLPSAWVSLCGAFRAKFLSCAELLQAGLRISRTGAKPRLSEAHRPPKHLRAPHCLDGGQISTISMRPSSRNLFYARDLI